MTDCSDYTCDVLIVGAGPAGIAAAVSASDAGASVVVVDDNASPGGQIWRGSAPEEGLGTKTPVGSKKALNWFERFSASARIFLGNTRVISSLGTGLVLAEGPAGASRLRYGRLVLATGARERFLPFPGWTLPNVLGAGGLQALVKSGLPIEGKRIVIAGSGPLLMAVASALQRKGAEVCGVFEQSPVSQLVPFALALSTQMNVATEAVGYVRDVGLRRYHTGWWPVSARGDQTLSSVELTNGKRKLEIECDYLACSFHLVANTEAAALLGCAVEDGRVVADEFQRTSVEGIYSAGEVAGIAGLSAALVEGQIAGLAAANVSERARPLLARRNQLRRSARRMDKAFALRKELRSIAKEETIVCRCEDVRWHDLKECSSTRGAKIYTRCGMGPCQGRICGAALQFLCGWEPESVRPPLYPAQLSTLLTAAANLKENL
jgi:NADPH-dependent 2,4-dienoyl-CoA reductase/sulfur reductase-like enzyme